MPAIPKYAQDLITQTEVHNHHLVNLRLDVDEFWKKNDLLIPLIAEMQKDIALMKQKLAELTDKINKWETRWWYLVSELTLALLTLASTLIVTLVKK